MTPVQVPLAAPVGETHRCVLGHGDCVTGSQLSWPQTPEARQLIDDEHVPHEPPHPSSPHCFPAQLGVQQRPLAAQEPVVQLPQLATVLGLPQLSGPLACPQVWFSRAQNRASVSLAQQPVGPQMGALAPHVPQSTTVRCRPHESMPVSVPQVRPERAQNAASASGMQQVPAFASHTPDEPATTAQVPHEETVRKVPQRSIVERAPHVRWLA